MNRYSPPPRKHQIAARSLVWVDVGGAPHPAIVVRLEPGEDRAVVLCGTGTRRAEYAVIEVPSRSAAGKALALTKDTFFYATQLRSVRLGHLRASSGRCPPDLFLQVRLLVEGALSILTPAEQSKGLAEDAIPRAAQTGAASSAVGGSQKTEEGG
ncbi:hypothetical protein [Cystobacter fuscus]|uniref:hypothetical protein n=1 Tax=Cystobacter fuscus TaxID=43 RepID=UPI0012FE36DC|nr:hypothetical protein [Cystobacter fuscus]